MTSRPWLTFFITIFFQGPLLAQHFQSPVVNRRDPDWESGIWSIGLINGSLDQPGSISGGISVAASGKCYIGHNYSFTVGTNLKIGLENQNGWGGPVTFAVVPVTLITQTDANLLGSNYATYAETPLLLRYNFGLGASNDTEKKWGFYLGGGPDYLWTGYTNSKGASQAMDYWAYTLEAGVRLVRHLELCLSTVQSYGQSAGSFPHAPAFYGLTISYFAGGDK
jgi:hypothetical protein